MTETAAPVGTEDRPVVLPVARVRHTLGLLDELVASGMLTRADAAAVVDRVRAPSSIPPRTRVTPMTTESVADGRVAMTPETELDLLTCPGWRRELIRAVERESCTILIIDLSQVTFFGAAGLSVLSEVRALAGLHGVELRVVVSSRPVLRPLQVTGMAGEFVIHRSRADALTAPPGAAAARR